jgi:Flp pilus assembly protein TadD
VGKKLLYSLALAASLPIVSSGCASAPKNPGQPSFMEKVGTSVKGGSSKVVAALTPNRNTADSPTPSPNGKPGPGVFVAMAQISERGQNFDEAEAQYKKALAIEPNHLGAMVGMAHLEDRRGHLEAATKLYLKAAKKHPKDASVHNDLGLCYHRRGMLPEATKSLEKAVSLHGESKLYRNNLAAVFVERGMNQEALAQLTTAHGDSIGHYNLAYLLEQKSDHQAALTHFQVAAQKDPSLLAAQQWVARLSAPQSQSGTQYAAAPQYAPPAAAASSYPPEPANSGFVQASGVSRDGQYPAYGPGSIRGVQYPQVRPREGAGDAVPPTPTGSRLPGVAPNGG